jgi:hypothetical protein
MLWQHLVKWHGSTQTTFFDTVARIWWCLQIVMVSLLLHNNAGDTSVPRRVLPFGDGIKNCVGQAYGQMLVRTGLALLLVRESSGWLPQSTHQYTVA